MSVQTQLKRITVPEIRAHKGQQADRDASPAITPTPRGCSTTMST